MFLQSWDHREMYTSHPCGGQKGTEQANAVGRNKDDTHSAPLALEGMVFQSLKGFW